MKSLAVSLPNCPDEYRQLVKRLPDGIKGQDLVLEGYAIFKDEHGSSEPGQRGLSGMVFELLIVDALYSNGVEPIYHQASILNVPNVRFDIVLYHPKYPAVISCKTSLRERWKQADLEGTAFKQVYRRGTSVLVTLSSEGHGIQGKIHAGDVHGLDQCIVLEKDGVLFQELLDKLSSTKFQVAEPVDPVTGSKAGN